MRFKFLTHYFNYENQSNRHVNFSSVPVDCAEDIGDRIAPPISLIFMASTLRIVK